MRLASESIKRVALELGGKSPNVLGDPLDPATPLNRRAPHGGFKQSGMSREWGRAGVEEFLAAKSVVG